MNTMTYYEEIESIVWCYLVNQDIPLPLCKCCKFHAGITSDNKYGCNYTVGAEYDNGDTE